MSLASVISGVATLASVVGSIVQGNAAAKQVKAEAEAGARQSEAQAKADREQAEREVLVAAQQEGDFRLRQRRAASDIRAAAGARGVSVDVGSILLTAEDFSRQTEIQALRIREGGEVRSTRLEQQADLLASRAGSIRSLGSSRASAARTAGFFGAGTSLLSGGFRTARILQEE